MPRHFGCLLAKRVGNVSLIAAGLAKNGRNRMP
jgi:hypothetical protein